MRHIVGVSDCVVSDISGDIIVTHALGSCIGIAVHDPDACVGGLVHYMLPLSRVDSKKAEAKPYMFGDTAISRLFSDIYELGGRKKNLRVVIAGGARVINNVKSMDIGKRNIVIARKLFWKNKIMIDAESVGGQKPRTLNLEIGSGRTWYTTRGKEYEL